MSEIATSLPASGLVFGQSGRSVGAVVRRVEKALQSTEIEPEWVSVANVADDDDEAVYGFRSTSLWPDLGGPRQRLTLSIERGASEGWIIQANYIAFVESGSSRCWQSHPLLRIKSLSRSQAWAVAAVVARLLDID